MTACFRFRTKYVVFQTKNIFDSNLHCLKTKYFSVCYLLSAAWNRLPTIRLFFVFQQCSYVIIFLFLPSQVHLGSGKQSITWKFICFVWRFFKGSHDLKAGGFKIKLKFNERFNGTFYCKQCETVRNCEHFFSLTQAESQIF